MTRTMLACVWWAAACGSVAQSPAEQQRSVARALEPEDLPTTTPRRAAEPVVDLRLRAWVHEDWVRSDSDPRRRMRETLADASAILEGQLGVRLQLVDLQFWTTDSWRTLPDALHALVAHDAGADVDVVVGFGPAPSFFTDTLHQLGYATVLGRHAVVRTVSDLQEANAIDTLLSRLPVEERSELIERRRRHKAAIVLVHEIAHVLGGVHVKNPEVVLYPEYSIDQNTLDEDAIALMRLGLAYHAQPPGKARAAVAAQIRAELRSRSARLDSDGVRELTAQLEQEESIAAGALVLAPADAAVFNAAVAKANAHAWADAYAILLPLASRDDAHPRVSALACSLAGLDGVVALDGVERCRRALSANPDDVAVAIDAAAVAERIGDEAGISSSLDEASRRAARAPAELKQRLQLARVAYDLAHLAVAEDAIDGMDDDDATTLRQRIALRRARAGLPRGTLTGPNERRALTLLARAYQSLDTDVAAAGRIVDEGLSSFGEVAGLHAARCAVELRAQRVRTAQESCARSLALYEESSVAHVLAASVVLARRGKIDDALGHYRRARVLDPDSEDAWRGEAFVLSHARRKAELAALASEYEQRFHRALRDD